MAIENSFKVCETLRGINRCYFVIILKLYVYSQQMNGSVYNCLRRVNIQQAFDWFII